MGCLGLPPLPCLLHYLIEQELALLQAPRLNPADAIRVVYPAVLELELAEVEALPPPFDAARIVLLERVETLLRLRTDPLHVEPERAQAIVARDHGRRVQECLLVAVGASGSAKFGEMAVQAVQLRVVLRDALVEKIGGGRRVLGLRVHVRAGDGIKTTQIADS